MHSTNGFAELFMSNFCKKCFATGLVKNTLKTRFWQEGTALNNGRTENKCKNAWTTYSSAMEESLSTGRDTGQVSTQWDIWSTIFRIKEKETENGYFGRIT